VHSRQNWTGDVVVHDSHDVSKHFLRSRGFCCCKNKDLHDISDYSILIFYLSVLSCIASSRNRTKRRWTKYSQQLASQNPVYVLPTSIPDAPPMEATAQEPFMHNGVLKRWQLVPVKEPVETHQQNTPREPTHDVEEALHPQSVSPAISQNMGYQPVEQDDGISPVRH
jgi:hypothetical protein